MNRASLGALLAALVLATLSACSSDDDGGGSAAPTETVTVEAQPEPLELTSDTGRSRACFDDPTPGDLAWFAAQWRANVDLEEFSFELVDAHGVKQVGSAETVPPVNYGGRIDFDGDATWDGHRRFLAKVPGIRGYDVESADFWSPITGQTGLVVLHLRFDPKILGSEEGGRIGGVRARYTTVDGQTGEATVETPRVIRAGDC